MWLLLAVVVIGVRVFQWHLLPSYMWSGDADSYAAPALDWHYGKDLVFSGVRGPTFTLLIAAALKIFGTLNGVPWLQHGLGALAIFLAVAVARISWGRVSVIPLFFCGVALGCYGLPLHLGQVIRNETLLLVFSTVAFGCWWLSLRWNSKLLLFLAAVAIGLGTMTKNVFVVMPLFFLAGAVLYGGPGIRGKILTGLVTLAGCALPFGALKVYNATAKKVEPSEPQAGILFYGRTAQWTVLDGGIEPDLKAIIAPDIAAYRQLPKLDNNIIIKRTAVPHLWTQLAARGQTHVDLDRLCRRLAIEAVRAHPHEFFQQMVNDLRRLHFEAGVKNEFPSKSQLTDAQKYLIRRDEIRTVYPAMEPERYLEVITGALNAPESFEKLRKIEEKAWLFQRYPVLFTTLVLPLVFFLTRGRDRFFFLGASAMWFSNMVLLSTVGRPLERYLMPLVPIMFWALSGLLIFLWALLWRERTRPVEAAVPPTPEKLAPPADLTLPGASPTTNPP